MMMMTTTIPMIPVRVLYHGKERDVELGRGGGGRYSFPCPFPCPASRSVVERCAAVRGAGVAFADVRSVRSSFNKSVS